MNLLKILLLLFLFFTVTNFAQDFDFFESETKIGGYGELHYNYEKPENSESKKTLDFHRFVLFFSHSFAEEWSFKSELELEHNFVKDGQGELELEQAFIDYHPSEYFGLQVGVILPSAGFLNEYHEPPLFFGVERPEYHNKIIPTTWFGNGASVYGNVKGFDYKFSVMEGMNSDKFSLSSGIRGGRVKGFKADAEELLYNFRVDFTGFPGLRFGASYSINDAKGDTSNISFSLAEFHATYQANNIYAVFEYGNISFDNWINNSAYGFYFDLGYDVASFFETDLQVIPFFRYTDYNTAAETVAGGDLDMMYHFTKWMAGVSFKPVDQVVFKIDIGERKRELGSQSITLFNIGTGYMF